MSADIAAMAPATELASTVRRGGQGTHGFSQDPNAFWQEVFDGARAVPQEQPSPQAAVAVRHMAPIPQPLQSYTALQPHMPAADGQPVAASARGAAQTPAMPGPAGRADNHALHTFFRANARSNAGRPATASLSIPWTPMPDAPSESAHLPPAARLWHALRAEDTASASAESVSVRTTADGIELLVRSPDLGAPEAIRYAREVARHLTGSTDTLRLLVLNGKTVYAAPAEAPVDELTPTGLLNIRC